MRLQVFRLVVVGVGKQSVQLAQEVECSGDCVPVLVAHVFVFQLVQMVNLIIEQIQVELA